MQFAVWALIAGLVVALSPAAALAQDENATSCDVSASNPSCTFQCDSGGFFSVAGAGLAGVVSGACGGRAASCAFVVLLDCAASSAITGTGGAGTCRIFPGQEADVGQVGSCSA